MPAIGLRLWQRDIASAGVGPTPDLDAGGVIDLIGRRHAGELRCIVAIADPAAASTSGGTVVRAIA